ncbi:MAG: VTT domain-containing protein [Candidatus Nomurabacteria bacterium]|nr:VTT domain-containing protein [Candidatus Nomurabacteria bacterium]
MGIFDPILIIKAVGIIGIVLIVFAETGLFFGFFLPGDSLLFTAGIFASQGFFNIQILLVGCILAAIIGDSVGYWSGKKYGRQLFDRDAGFFFKKKRLYDAELFYEKYGKSTIIIARFVPMIRTFAPIVAGIGNMKYRSFVSYNIFGGIIWVSGLLLLGYFLGGIIHDPEIYIIPIAVSIIILSFIPIFIKMIVMKFKK